MSAAAGPEILLRLAQTIASRRGGDPENSHTAKLLAKGPEKCAEKFGEEAIEAIIEAVRGDKAKLASEAADVLYHLLVMLAAREVPFSAVLDDLARREGRSGLAEKAARFEIRRAEPGDIAQCLEIRRIVFIEEQGVDPALEIDGKDGLCRHWIAEQRGRAVATARALIEEGRAKIQRVAVLAGARGTGLGRQLMETVLADLRADPAVSAIWLESQVQALPFYERLGFVAYGARFLDAGIPHRRMLVPAAPEDVPALVAAFAARAEGALARLWAQPQREGAGEPERARLEADTRAAMASFAEEIAQLEQPSEELRLIDAMRRFFDALRAVDETAAEGFLGPEERDVLVPFAIELAALKGLRPSDWPHGDPTHGLRTI